MDECKRDCTMCRDEKEMLTMLVNHVMKHGRLGKWETEVDGVWCSNCESYFFYDEDGKYAPYYDYCPECGARMLPEKFWKQLDKHYYKMGG